MCKSKDPDRQLCHWPPEPGLLDMLCAVRSKGCWKPYAPCLHLLCSRQVAAGTPGATPGLARRTGPDGEQ